MVAPSWRGSRGVGVGLDHRRSPILNARSLNSGAILKGSRDGLELGQGSGQILNDFAGDDLRGRQVVEVLQGLVPQPGDVEVGLVPCHQLVVSEEPVTLRHDPLRTWLARYVAIDE